MMWSLIIGELGILVWLNGVVWAMAVVGVLIYGTFHLFQPRAKRSNQDHLRKLTTRKQRIFEELRPLFDILWPVPPDWAWRRMQIIERDKFCQQCNRKWYASTVPFHVHHRIPKVRTEGTHALSNLILLCEICHAKQESHGHSLVSKSREDRLRRGTKKSKNYEHSFTARNSVYW